ncbi:hypothetical protein ACLBPA_27395, partial [Klebsiella pneumoniae]
MDFTAGLMPLDTALAQMLDRITEWHRVVLFGKLA